MNTEKVAKAMAEAMNATLRKFGEVRPEDLAGYDLGLTSPQGTRHPSCPGNAGLRLRPGARRPKRLRG